MQMITDRFPPGELREQASASHQRQIGIDLVAEEGRRSKPGAANYKDSETTQAALKVISSCGF